MAATRLLRLAHFAAIFVTSIQLVSGNSETAAATDIVNAKCREYKNMVSEAYPVMTLALDSEVRYTYILNCPLQNPYVVGGRTSSKHEFPHMAALGYKVRGGINRYKFDCGGTLISERFVLSAAHCVNPALEIVRLGVVDLEDPEAQDFRIERRFTHEDYSPVTKYDDIALLELARNVTITLHLRPACLGTELTERITRATVTGWGATGPATELSTVLNKVSLDVPRNQRRCTQMYAGLGRSALMSRQICAGSLEGELDACQGDSGGPLQVFEEGECRYHVIGVVSFGNICGSAEYGVYTRVSSYLAWIVAKVWPEELASE